MIELQGFKVAAVYSDDLGKSLSFYENVLGFVKVDDAGGGAHLKLDRGEKSIMIYLQGGFPRDNRTPDNSKISLMFDSSAIKSVTDKVRGLGIPISMPYTEIAPGLAMVGIQDPSGNQIMLMGAP